MSEKANERFAQKNRAICSFAHLSWATWVNRSRSLICHERPKRFAHGCSFDMSDLSDLLTVAHLSWGIWANRSQLLIWFDRSERMSKWAMSQWVNSQPWFFQPFVILLRYLKWSCIVMWNQFTYRNFYSTIRWDPDRKKYFPVSNYHICITFLKWPAHIVRLQNWLKFKPSYSWPNLSIFLT